MKERQLELKIDGPLFHTRSVTVNLLVEKLQAAQKLVFGIGSALLNGGSRGSWKGEVARGCALNFIESRTGCLEIVTEVPAVDPKMATEDIGKTALVSLANTLEAIIQNKPEQLAVLYPDSGNRERILKAALTLLPEEEADYVINIETAGKKFQLNNSVRCNFEKLLRKNQEIAEPGVCTLTGKLYLIEVETGERRLGIIVNNRRITCFFGRDYEDIVKNLVPGSLIEIEGVATLNERGEVQQIETILDVRSLSLYPINWKTIVCEDRKFYLRESIEIVVDFQDKIWIYEYKPINIIGYSASRQEALQAFRVDFAASWDFLAEEQDDNLTIDAKAMKDKLKELVEKVEPL